MKIKMFTFGPFQENTYVLFDDSKEAVIVDPGCFDQSEKDELAGFIKSNNLRVVQLLNTHCHVDHVAGNAFVYEIWGLKPLIHKADLPVLESQERVSQMYGLPCELSPEPGGFMEDGEQIKFGNTVLDIIHAPGHAPGHVVFYHKPSGNLINGDVLFRRSIGRTDLPLGNHEQLLHSIRTKIFTLPPETVVHCGHGPTTTIGEEMRENPFVRP